MVIETCAIVFILLRYRVESVYFGDEAQSSRHFSVRHLSTSFPHLKTFNALHAPYYENVMTVLHDGADV